MEYIKVFDNKIKQDVLNLKERIKDLNFNPQNGIEFTLNSQLDLSQFKSQKPIKGVYLFEVKLDSAIKGAKPFTKIKNFSEAYSTYENRHIYSSKVIQKRVDTKENHTDEWLPIYIGKCKDVYKRVLEHISLPTDKRTYAMKLLSRENLYGINFRISVLEIDIEHYDLIMGFIEKEMREKYNPIIGKQ